MKISKEGTKSEHKDDESIDSYTPLSQVLKQNKKNKKEDLRSDKKRRKWRNKGKDTTNTNEFAEANKLVKDPDLKVTRISKIKDNTPLDEERSKAEKKWNKLVQKDFSMQKKAYGIEYVNVEKCKNLHIVSKNYMSTFNSMTKEEKINLLEIEQYNSDVDGAKLKDQNHFLLHLRDGNPVVIHRNWFDIEQDDLMNTETRRINVKTEQKCYKQPNKIHNLSTDEKRSIKNACNVMERVSQIEIIKRLPDDRNNVQYYETKFGSSTIRTSIKYIGIDHNNITCPLEDQWLKDNFNTPKTTELFGTN